MTLIMRVKEETSLHGDLLCPQVQHLFCFRQRSLSPPLRGGGMKRGMKRPEDRTLQRLFGLTMGCFCLPKRWVCVWREGLGVCVCARERDEELLPHGITIPPHTHAHKKHTQISSLILCSDLLLTSASIWFTCPQGISSSCCQLITLCPTIILLWLQTGLKTRTISYCCNKYDTSKVLKNKLKVECFCKVQVQPDEELLMMLRHRKSF